MVFFFLDKNVIKEIFVCLRYLGMLFFAPIRASLIFFRRKAEKSPRGCLRNEGEKKFRESIFHLIETFER